MTLSEVLAEMRAAGSDGRRALLSNIAGWAATLSKYEPLVAAEWCAVDLDARTLTLRFETPELVCEALALFTPKDET